MQALRDGDLQDEARLTEAVDADPLLAPAQLRLALRLMLRSPADGRIHFAQAQKLADTLSVHDCVLLDAVEPFAQRDPVDVPEFERRTREAHERSPHDVEFAEWMIIARDGYASTAEQLGDLDRLIGMDPHFGYAYYLRAYYEAYTGDFEGERRTIDKCVEMVPSAGRCFMWINEVERQIGPPARLEVDARRWLAVSPRAGNGALAEALLAEGRPLDTVREAVDQDERIAPLPDFPGDKHYALDVLAGDFVAAEGKAQLALTAVERDLARSHHALAVRRLVELLLEEGDDARAANLANGYLLRKDVWAPDPRREDFAIARDPTPFMMSVVVHAGKAPHDKLVSTRSDWLRDWRPVVRPFYARYLWPHAFAATVETPDEAIEAVGAMDPSEPIPAFWPLTFLGGDIGRTFFLAGRNDEALRWLREAADSAMAFEYPIEHTRAHYWLGQALERAGDRNGACRAYEYVILRWGKAKPHSVTAARAEERMKVLGCH